MMCTRFLNGSQNLNGIMQVPEENMGKFLYNLQTGKYF